MLASIKISRTTLCVVAGLLFVAQSSQAQIIFEDGGINVVDSVVSSHVIVRDSSEGAPTTLLVQAGADIPTFDPDGEDTSIFVEGSSIIEMTDGMTVGGMNLFDDATGLFTGGIVGDELEVRGNSIITIGTAEGGPVPDIQDDLETFNNGFVDMFDGRVFDDVEANDSSVINFYGGEFDEDVEAFDNATITIFGGQYSTGFGDLDDIEGGKIEVENDDEGNINTATIKVCGGTFVGALFDPDFAAEGEGTIYIFGTDFAIDGNAVEYGEIMVASGQLTGTLADGFSMLDNDFEINDNGRIILVLLGDVNGDGEVNLLDVSPFVDLLTDGGFQIEADINCDGEVNLLDVAPFVDLLSG